MVLVFCPYRLQDNGVTFDTEGQERQFRGSIGPYSADNLGAHAIGGFIESFSGLRICRVCMATKNDIQTKVSWFPNMQTQFFKVSYNEWYIILALIGQALCVIRVLTHR